MTLTLGTWLMPFAATMAVWAWAIFKLPDPRVYRSHFERMGEDVVAIIRLGVALIVSLIAWLAWAICVIVQAPH